jgi:hypothetical protein
MVGGDVPACPSGRDAAARGWRGGWAENTSDDYHDAAAPAEGRLWLQSLWALSYSMAPGRSELTAARQNPRRLRA